MQKKYLIIILALSSLVFVSLSFSLGFFLGQKSLSQPQISSETGINSTVATDELIPTFSPSPLSTFSPPTPSPISDETRDWKTYRNEKYGFEIKYPPYLEITNYSTLDKIFFSYPGIPPLDLITGISEIEILGDNSEDAITIDSLSQKKVGEKSENQYRIFTKIGEESIQGHQSIRFIQASAPNSSGMHYGNTHGVGFKTKDHFFKILSYNDCESDPCEKNIQKNLAFFNQILSTFKLLD